MELGVMLPLITDKLLESLKITIETIYQFDNFCVSKIIANEEKCLFHLENSNAYATLLVPKLGYDMVSKIVDNSIKSKRKLRDVIIEDNYLSIKRNFSQTIITKNSFNTNNYENIFYCLEHILDYNKQIDKIDKIIYIDGYLNNCLASEIDDLLKSYNSYKDIFNNIFVPLFQRKFYAIRESLKNEKSLS